MSPYPWRICLRHRYAIDLFHHGFYWESHEVWEDLWHRVPPASAERHVLAGLIQLAASALKVRMGHDRAATTLLKNARRNLTAALRTIQTETSSSDGLALDLPALLKATDAWAGKGQKSPAPGLPFLGASLS